MAEIAVEVHHVLQHETVAVAARAQQTANNHHLHHLRHNCHLDPSCCLLLFHRLNSSIYSHHIFYRLSSSSLGRSVTRPLFLVAHLPLVCVSQESTYDLLRFLNEGEDTEES